MIELFGTQLATKDDLAEYMFTNVEQLPQISDQLLARASEMIHMAMGKNFNSSKETHVVAAKLATCAQVQDWLSRDSDGVSSSDIQSYSLGDLSVQKVQDAVNENRMCVTAVRYLNSVHLLYKGGRR